MNAWFAAVAAACNAFVAWVRWQQHVEIEKIEDEILSIGPPVTATDKLRIDLLEQRKKRKLEQVGTV